MGSKTLPGIFMGYCQHAGGGWTGDLLVLDPEQLEKAEGSHQVYIKRFKSPEVIVTNKGSTDDPVFLYPVASGKVKQPQTIDELKKSKSA